MPKYTYSKWIWTSTAKSAEIPRGQTIIHLLVHTFVWHIQLLRKNTRPNIHISKHKYRRNVSAAKARENSGRYKLHTCTQRTISQMHTNAHMHISIRLDALKESMNHAQKSNPRVRFTFSANARGNSDRYTIIHCSFGRSDSSGFFWERN